MLNILWMITLCLLGVQTEKTIKGSCDSESIPYRITVDKNGSAELFCAQPSCLGDDLSKEPTGSSSIEHVSKNFNVSCDDSYKEKVCDKNEEWTGGLMEVTNGTHVTLKTKCCSYPGLVYSTFARTIFLHHEEEFTGGFYAKDNTVVAFDLVKELRKMVNGTKIKYVATIVRIPCFLDLPDKKETLEPLNDAVSAEEEVQLSRNKRRLPYKGDKDVYLPMPPAFSPYAPYVVRRQMAAPLRRRRRPIGSRRQALKRILDYYDDDYEEEEYYPAPRHKGNQRNEVLWPFLVSTRPRQQGEDNVETEPVYNNELTMVDSGSADQLVVNQAGRANMVASKPMYEAPKFNYPVMDVQQPSLPPPDRAPQVYQPPPPSSNYNLPPPDRAQVYQPPPPPVSNYLQPPPSSNYVAPPAPDPNSYALNFQNRQPPVVDQAPEMPQPPPQPQQPPPQPPQQQQIVYQPSYQPAYQAYQPSYPSYPSYPYTGQEPNLNNLFSKMQCFTGSDKVETPSGSKAIEDLEVGDLVLSMDENMVTYSPVIMFLHKIENENASFIQVETKSSILKLTEFHLIYKSSCEPNSPLKLVAAKDVEEDDCVYVLNNGRGIVPERVMRTDKVMGQGIYAPLTSSGDIFVNRVLASCHSNLGLKTLQQTFFNTYRGVSSFFRRFLPSTSSQQDLPLGVGYLTSVIDLFLPASYV